MATNLRPILEGLENDKLYAFSNITGLDGYENQFLKKGGQFVPVIGDASQFGPIKQLSFSAQELSPYGGYGFGGGIENGIFTNGLKSIREKSPTGISITRYQDAQGNLFQDPYGKQAIGSAQGRNLYATPTVEEQLNDTTTPRSFGAETVSGAEGVARQQQYVNDYNAETNKVTPYGYQETEADKQARANLLKGIPIGLQNAPTTQPKYVSSYKGNSVQDFLTSAGQDGSYAARAKLAAELGITGYKGSEQQNLALLAKLRGATSATPAGTPPTPSSGLTTESLQSASGVTLPGANGDGGAANANAMVAGANASIAEIIKSLTPAETEADKKQQTLLDQMTSLVGENAKKASDQLTAEQSAGLPQLRQQFADINGKILTQSAEYNVLLAANANKPITMNSIIGNERAILNAKAADIGLLTAQSQALQGQIETAQNTVNRAVDLKYSSIAAALDVYQAQLNALQPILNKQEKLQAQAQQIYLENQRQALADVKNKEKEINNLVMQASLAGATPAQISAISNAKDVASATQLSASVIGKAKQAEMALDNKIKQAQLSKIYSDIAKDKAANNQVVDVSKINAIPGLSAETKNQMIITEFLKNPKLGQTTRTNIGNSLGVIKSLEDIAQANQDSSFTGVSPFNSLLNVKIPFTDIGLPFRQAAKQEKAIQNEGYIEAINLKVQQWASGASLTNQQTEKVNKLVPLVTDTDANFKTKINNLANFMLTQSAAQLQTEGIDFKPEKVNLFETGDLLKQASPEQLAELKKQGLIK